MVQSLNQTISFKDMRECDNCKESGLKLNFDPILMMDLCDECNKKLLIKTLQDEPERFYNYVNIPRFYSDCKFESFKTKSKDSKVTEIYIKIKSLMQDYVKKNESLFLSGICGSGKTMLAVSVLREKIRLLISISKLRFEPVRNILSNIKETYNNNYVFKETEKSILENYSNYDFLVLDDFGYDAKPSNNQINILYSLIDERINKNKQTMITSNLTINQINDVYGSRIASRISGFIYIRIDGIPDYRKFNHSKF